MLPRAAIVGNVNASEGVGARKKSEGQPHAQLTYAPGVEMPRQIEAEREAVPVAGGAGHSVYRMHGARGGAPKGNRNALKGGLNTAEAIETRRMVSTLGRLARETMAGLE